MNGRWLIIVKKLCFKKFKKKEFLKIVKALISDIFPSRTQVLDNGTKTIPLKFFKCEITALVGDKRVERVKEWFNHYCLFLPWKSYLNCIKNYIWYFNFWFKEKYSNLIFHIFRQAPFNCKKTIKDNVSPKDAQQ